MEEEIDADRLWSSLDKVGLKGVVEGLGEREHTFITRLFFRNRSGGFRRGEAEDGNSQGCL